MHFGKLSPAILTKLVSGEICTDVSTIKALAKRMPYIWAEQEINQS
jgi:hypothetical protein